MLQKKEAITKFLTMTTACVDRYMNNSGIETNIQIGGEAVNFATNCCTYPYIDVHFLGGIGADTYGELIKNTLSNYPIHLEHLHILSGTTANNITYLTDNGDRYYKEDSWTGGVYQDFKLSDLDKLFMKSVDLIHTSINCPNFTDILETRKQTSLFLAVDFNTHRHFTEWETLLPWIDFFFISADKETLSQLKTWSKKYPCIFIGTAAAEGSFAYQNGQEFKMPAMPCKEIIDTTGCGDSFQAGFLADYVKNHDIIQALKEGTRLATDTLSHFGGVRLVDC